MQTVNKRCVRDAAADLGLHFLHMSKGPLMRVTGHMYTCIFMIYQGCHLI